MNARKVRPCESDLLALGMFRHFCLSYFLLLLSAGIAVASPQQSFLQPRISLTKVQGFCPDGVPAGTKWLEPKPDGLLTWGSFCKDGEATTGSAASSAFPAPAHLQLYLAGYPSTPAVSLVVERPSDGLQFALRPIEQPHENWRLYDFSIPSSWQGVPIRLIAKVNNAGPGGWFGFSEPVESLASNIGFRDALSLLLRTILPAILIFLPGLAVCALVISKGVRDVVVAGAIILAAVGASAYFAFWLWFLSPRLGHAIFLVMPIMALAILIRTLPKLDASGRMVLKTLLTPILLTGAVSLLVLSTGFVYGGLSHPLTASWRRFTHELPVDNWLPYLFAEGVRAGHVPKPLFGDWLSSDRPPLQAGLALSQYPYTKGPRDLGYTIISVIGQSFWIFGLWILLIALGASDRAVRFALAVTLFSGFVFLNSFYVWPKLIAAAFMLALAGVVLSNRLGAAAQHGTMVSVAAGGLFAFGLLSHGGSAFAACGLILTTVVLKCRVTLKSGAIAAATLAALYLPWIFYQRFYDPPGDRLIRMHLAGVDWVDFRPVGTVIAAAYGSLTAGQILNYKLDNFSTIVAHTPEYWTNAAALVTQLVAGNGQNGSVIAQSATKLRQLGFYFFLPNLGFLALGVPALAIGARRKFRSPEWRTAAIVWLLIAFTIIPWCLIMFGPNATILHSGTYMIVLAAYASCVLALWAASRPVALLVGLLQIALNFMLYVFWMRLPVPSAALPDGFLQPGMLALALLSLALVLFLLRKLMQDFNGIAKE